MIRRRVLLDANILLLLVAGWTDRRIIQVHKRLRMFRDTDFDLIATFIGDDGELVLLQSIITETSNILRYIQDPYKTALLTTMQSLVDTCDELSVISRQAVTRAEFVRLGFTDAAILQAMDSEIVLLTADLDLFLAALAGGLTAFNFHQLRDQAG